MNENKPIDLLDTSLLQHKNYMFITYGTFAISLFLPFIAIVGVILAYMKREEVANTIYANHLNYLIRTFWGSIIGGIIGFILSIILVGYVVLFIVSIWYIFRIIYGFIKLTNYQSVSPTSWLK
ncbi:DUF4870 family protein [Seminibacterium arietis]|uniref:DUF4870 family protein n=1 Tax=Seminibacterium arietis TaxID=1173502 RepID=A0ABW3I9V9_9PAST